MVPSYKDRGLSLLVREAFIDVGEVDSMEAGGVGIDADSDVLLDVLGVGDFAGLAVDFEDPGVDVVDDSVCPHEARTLFSTLTVSSRNIKDNWSLYPGQALDNRTHCVHSGCLLSHLIRRLRHPEHPNEAFPQ